MRVLVTEDDEVLAAAVAAGLRREGMAVDVALDGGAALERLAVNRYDVLVLDRGEIDGIAPVSVNASQTDSVVSGSATLTYNSTTYNGTFTGISVPPAINLTVTNGDSTGTYAGTWITRDSIAGTFTVGGTTGALSLKQQ